MKDPQLLNLSDLVVCPDWCFRNESPAIDARDRDSVEKHGILDPLVAVRDGDRLLLTDGLRRRTFSIACGRTKGPVMTRDAPTGETPEGYARKLRFILNYHRQPLAPSVRAKWVSDVMEALDFNQRQVARHLNVEEDTITEWLRVLKYIRPVVTAIDRDESDAGHLPLKYAAAVFKDLTHDGQERIWKHHARQILKGETDGILDRYPPDKYPTFWTSVPKPRVKTQPK
jgi:ParB-like chromosome segregation protein Spo0J